MTPPESCDSIGTLESNRTPGGREAAEGGTRPITFRADPGITATALQRGEYILRHKIFVGYVAVMVLIFLAPVPSTQLADSNQLDKLVHFGIFLVFALLFHVDRAPGVWWGLVTALGFAAAIELVQAVLPYRDGDVWDFVAGAAGATCGTLLMIWFSRQARRTDPG